MDLSFRLISFRT